MNQLKTIQPDFKFNREISTEELNFWTSFFNNFPSHHNCYFQSVLNNYSNKVITNSFIENFDLEQSYLKIKDCSTKEEMFETIKDLNWTDVAQDKFKKIISLYDTTLTTKPINLFLFSIYAAFIQEWDLEISKDGISIMNKKAKDIDRKTFAPQLAMVADLMAGRINDFFPTLKIQPIEFSGETIIINIENQQQYVIVTKDKKENSNSINDCNSYSVERWIVNKENIANFEFSFHFYKNSNLKNEQYAPLEFKQEILLKLIQKNNLELTLPSSQSQIKSRKI